MLNRIKQFFDSHLKPEAETNTRHSQQLAAAALLLEMARVDDTVKEVERHAVARAIRKAFELSESETAEIIRLAESEAHNATCYHEFTRLINTSYTLPQKIQLVELLWEVAYADDELEMYEEHLVRKLADLLYVPHRDFIRAKLRVIERHNPA